MFLIVLSVLTVYDYRLSMQRNSEAFSNIRKATLYIESETYGIRNWDTEESWNQGRIVLAMVCDRWFRAERIQGDYEEARDIVRAITSTRWDDSERRELAQRVGDLHFTYRNWCGNNLWKLSRSWGIWAEGDLERTMEIISEIKFDPFFML